MGPLRKKCQARNNQLGSTIAISDLTIICHSSCRCSSLVYEVGVMHDPVDEQKNNLLVYCIYRKDGIITYTDFVDSASGSRFVRKRVCGIRVGSCTGFALLAVGSARHEPLSDSDDTW